MIPLLRRVLLALGFGLALAAFQTSAPGQRIEHGWGLAGLYALRGPVAVPPGAMVIALDDAGAEWLAFVAGGAGALPPRLSHCLSPEDRARLARVTNVMQMPRAVHACLIDILAARGARLIVFDIVFRAARQDDTGFAAALAAGPPAVLLEGIDTPAGSGALRRERPAPAFAEIAAATAFFRVVMDGDGLLLGIENRVEAYPALPTLPDAAVAVFEGRQSPLPDPEAPPVDLLWHYGPALSVPTIPLRAVFDEQTPEDRALRRDLSDTAVFVGISDPRRAGESDHFRTVITGRDGSGVAGVELAATGFLNRLHGDRLHRPRPSATAALTALLGVVAVLLAATVGGWRGAGRVATLGVSAAAMAAMAFLWLGLWLPIGVPVALGLPLVALTSLVQGYRNTRATLRRRLAGPVAQTVLETDGQVPVDLREQAATVLFCDIAGSVSLSDRLSTLAYSALLIRFQSAATSAVEAQGGIVVEIEGDSLLAVFPEDPKAPPHARRACRAAMALSRTAADALPDPTRRPLTTPHPVAPLRLRIGLEAGAVMLGEIQSGDRYAYRVVGAVVNTAQRLEDGARSFLPEDGSAALVSDAVHAMAAGVSDLRFDRLGSRVLAGKIAPIDVWRLHLPL